jgi:hypothetical protein
MSTKSWLIALVALVLGAGAAVTVTQGLQNDSTVAAPPTESSETEKSGGSRDEGSKDPGEEKKDAEDERAAEQQVEQTVNAYVEALVQGDTEAICDIQAETFNLKVAASGVSGEAIAEACAEAASHADWSELWAAWARQIDVEDVQIDIDGAGAQVSLVGGGSFSLDRQRSGEWKVDGVRPPTAEGQPSGGGVPSGGNLPSGGGADLPSPQIPKGQQVPQRPQIPQR